MSASSGSQPYYYVPHPSRHPAFAAFGLFFVIFGAAQWVNGADWGKWPVAFVIDPKLPKDVTTITLSYTFFEVGGKTPPAPTARVPVQERGG